MDTYVTHFGKPYQNEIGIISLTSWAARIKTAPLTIFTLIKYCPEFHKVIVLSETEFPNKEADLPTELIYMCKLNYLEILWIKPNVRSFKKILFTIDTYKNVPVISADDDCLYRYNYAKELYDIYKQSTIPCCVTEHHNVNFIELPNGAASLYPPYCFKEYGLQCLTDYVISTNNDDSYYAVLLNKLHIPIKYANGNPFIFHDEIQPMGDSGAYSRDANLVKHLYEIITV